jgi:hypothetical protein
VVKFDELNSSEKAGIACRGVHGHARPKSHKIPMMENLVKRAIRDAV